MTVAKEYPALNIIYHPGHPQNNLIFDEKLKAHRNPLNVVRASKDVVFIADELSERGINCALHNPSDADVVYGAYDIGQYWKTGKGANYVGEEHIASMSTAPINSFGLNRRAYQKNIIERSLVPQSSKQSRAITDVKVIVQRYLDKNKEQIFGSWYEGGWHGSHGRGRANTYNKLLNSNKPAIQLSAIMALLLSNKRSSLREGVITSLQQVYGLDKEWKALAGIIKDQIWNLSHDDLKAIKPFKDSIEFYKKIIEPIMGCAEQKIYFNGGKDNSTLSQNKMKEWNKQLRAAESEFKASGLYRSIAP